MSLILSDKSWEIFWDAGIRPRECPEWYFDMLFLIFESWISIFQEFLDFEQISKSEVEKSFFSACGVDF